jgi:HSP20 family protein
MASRWQSLSPLFNRVQGNSPWSQLQELQREMNRLFDRWGDGGAVASGRTYPAVNVWEDGEALHLEAELPGVSQKELEVLVTGQNQLSIKGERKPEKLEKAIWHRQERGFGTFSRVLNLPYPVDSGKVEARLENGVLHVKLAKHEAAKARKISVKSE